MLLCRGFLNRNPLRYKGILYKSYSNEDINTASKQQIRLLTKQYFGFIYTKLLKLNTVKTDFFIYECTLCLL